MSDLPVQQQAGALDLPEGLEDFEASDMSMPVIRIDHDECKFEDALSGVKYDEIDAVVLGLIKQRVLWPAQQGEKDKPLCRSFDAKTGYPQDGFPWKATNFTTENVSVLDPNAEGQDIQYLLACKSCPLAEWDSHPSKDSPWCALQHTFALLMYDPVGEIWVPTLMTVQRSALKNSNGYLTAFARSKKPTFTVFTKLSLEARTRGTNDFAVPKFARSGATDEANWPYYSEQYQTIRAFVQSPRFFTDSKDDDTGTGPAGAAPAAGPGPAAAPVPAPAANAAPTAPAAAPPAAPVAPPAAETAPEPTPAPDVPAEAPVAAPAAPVAPAPVAPPAAAPPAVPAPPAPPAPPAAAAPPTAAPPVAAPPAVAPPAAAPANPAPSGDDDLPF